MQDNTLHERTKPECGTAQAFHYDTTAATTSAFVQQRGKLLPTAFEEILRRFTYQNRPIRRWNGYTLLAADGSHVQIPSDIHDKATYFNSTKDGRGYNLLHLNALYDLESQVYLDAIIQDGREEHESQALVELVDRSELTEPVILVADRGYEAYNNMAHIEQKGWKYLIRVKDKQGLLSGLRLTGAPEFDAAFSYSLSKRLTNRIRQEPHKYRWIPKKVHFRLYWGRKRCIVSNLFPCGQICGERRSVRDRDHQPSRRSVPASAAS